ncbi:hypothetical protein PsYK624_067620 [Phanerochaete sordida]|uniref:CENP-V/GFA domain-containing protein n=1 Tax=Phanerochaete sordida TaxID=48140 RepID=A0A9P3G7B2_9APHY|nr:hypothetical protein PsYK624_067620 [Phanerochaete sordida]
MPTLDLSASIPQWPADAEIKEYTGGCHCKRFRYRFTHPVFENGQYNVVVCNCSFCVVHAKMNIYAHESKLELTAGSMDELTLYQYNAKVIEHYFCPTCGVNFLTKGFGHVVINVRTVDGVDLAKLKIKEIDLKNV